MPASHVLGPVFAAAEQYAAAGLSIIPIKPDGSKRPCVAWAEYQSRIAGPEERSQWFGNGARSGIAVICGPVSRNLEVLDFDDPAAFQEWAALLKESLPETAHALVVTQTPGPGVQALYRRESAPQGNQVLARGPDKQVRIETRGTGGYVIAPPSGPECHPNKRAYRLRRGDLAHLPVIGDAEVEFMLSLARALDESPAPAPLPERPESPVARPQPDGGRPGDDFNARGSWRDLLEPAGWTCTADRGDYQEWKRPGDTEKECSATVGGPHLEGHLHVFSTNALPFESGENYSLFSAFALLHHGGDYKAAARALGEQGFGAEKTATKATKGGFVAFVAEKLEISIPTAPLDLAPEAIYGLPGMAADAIAPHTESGASAVLASFLVGAGCLIGRGPHVYRDGAQHGVNEFACLVGVTAAGRKGTATRRTEEIFERVGGTYNISQHDILRIHDTYAREDDRQYWRSLVLTGLGSGEALVAALSAASGAGETPRRLVFEEEFSKCLKVIQREGSTLSETLRAAWDGGVLANVTKGKTLRAADSHVCILSHVTEAEMRLRLGAAEMFNGFANRFLWFCTQRARSLPFGGGDAPVAPVVSALRQALVKSRSVQRVEFDAQVKELWGKGGVYDRLLARPPGLLGAVTSRAEAHVTRLALEYCLLDGEQEIRLPHMLAALAVWDFNERSCAYLFGQSTGDDYADTILELLQDVHPGGLTRTEIRDRFQRHAAPGRIPTALALLEREGKAVRVCIDSGGRPVEYWCAVSAKTRDQSDKSPLEIARELS